MAFNFESLLIKINVNCDIFLTLHLMVWGQLVQYYIAFQNLSIGNWEFFAHRYCTIKSVGQCFLKLALWHRTRNSNIPYSGKHWWALNLVNRSLECDLWVLQHSTIVHDIILADFKFGDFPQYCQIGNHACHESIGTPTLVVPPGPLVSSTQLVSLTQHTCKLS